MKGEERRGGGGVEGMGERGRKNWEGGGREEKRT
jgi:hypothetical protein